MSGALDAADARKAVTAAMGDQRVDERAVFMSCGRVNDEPRRPCPRTSRCWSSNTISSAQRPGCARKGDSSGGGASTSTSAPPTDQSRALRRGRPARSTVTQPASIRVFNRGAAKAQAARAWRPVRENSWSSRSPPSPSAAAKLRRPSAVGRAAGSLRPAIAAPAASSLDSSEILHRLRIQARCLALEFTATPSLCGGCASAAGAADGGAASGPSAPTTAAKSGRGRGGMTIERRASRRYGRASSRNSRR